MDKHKKRLQDAFGLDEYGMLQVPTKISGRVISRCLFTLTTGGCSYCFPHGYESTTSRLDKQQRSWKRYRRTQWREKQPHDSKNNTPIENDNIDDVGNNTPSPNEPLCPSLSR